MKFGSFPLDEAIGGILAHTQRLPDDSVIRKGTVLTDELIDVMHAASMTEVIVALPEAGDVLEDEAALQIASLVASPSIRMDEAKTGRVNFYATCNGVFRVSGSLVDRINTIDSGITFATLHDYAEVNAGRMVATVKIIPYAVSADSLEQIKDAVKTELISVSPFVSKKVGLIFTLLPGIKQSVLKKTRKTLERRLALSNSEIIDEKLIFHLQDDVQKAIYEISPSCDLIILFGASAISDENDIIPAAIEAAGGANLRFGMPVDPGNLMLLSELNGKPVVGAPGCARSPAENGFDWVLQRLLADIPVTSRDIASLGVGGLLMETGARPHPREKAKPQKNKTAAIILAAGQSRRMGSTNKMTVAFDGKPMVRYAAEAAADSNCAEVIIVTGHQAEEVETVLEGLDCSFVHNPDFSEGLSTSLAMGVEAISSDCTSAIVLLGDMPFITAENLNDLVLASEKHSERIIVPTSNGKRGNPVLWPARCFSELKTITGDVGARHIIGANSEMVFEVELGERASIDLDTLSALEKYTVSENDSE